MSWTHIYDSILKLAVWLLLVLAFFNPPYFTEFDLLNFIVPTAISILIYVFFLRTLGSYLYCRFRLKMNLTFDEAKALNEALSPNPFPYFDQEWLPLKEVKSLPEHEKYPAALSMLESWKEAQKQKWQDKKRTFSSSPVFVKLLDILSIIAFLVFLATSILNLPPASYLIDLYCYLFDTKDYDPMLITMLMTLVVVVPILFYKRSKGIKLFF